MSQALLGTHSNGSSVGADPAKPASMPHSSSVDLTSGQHRIAQLEACDSINDARKLENALFLDLSQCGIALPIQSYAHVHLKFPSTLLRRPKFQFPQLVKTLDHETQRVFESEVSSHTAYVFYDEGSTLQHCSPNTSQILTKLVPYLAQRQKGTHLVFLQGGRAQFQDKSELHSLPISRPPHLMNTKSSINARKGAPSKHNMNLKITIPSRNARTENSNYMFIQSFKKDTIQYSPDSVQKYFTFHIPATIQPNDSILPTWLKSFSKDGNKNLLRILNSFEHLERLEIKRLERCLQSYKVDSTPRSQEVYSNADLGPRAAFNENFAHDQRPRTAKLYSFREMQKQYQPNRHDYDSDNDGYHQGEEIKLKLDISEELNDGENQKILSKLQKAEKECDTPSSVAPVICNDSSNQAAAEVNHEEDEEVVETPMDNYLLTRGIQSFTKNRYSNILPYEHSRVKLEPSPIWPDNKQGQNSCLPSSGPDSPLSTNAMRKRRNSYFSQGCGSRDKLTDPPKPENTDSSSNTGPLSPSSENEKPPSVLASERESFNDYFNANYLKIPQINPDFNYIATQAPLPSTLDDFWKVVIANDVKVIISLNSDDELSMRKWDVYWNSSSLKKFDVSVSTTIENVAGVEGCILRVFSVKRHLASAANRSERTAATRSFESSKDEKCGTALKKSKSDTSGEYSSTSNDSLTPTYTIFQLQYTKWLDSCGIVMSDVLKLHRIKTYLLNNATSFMESIKEGKVYEDLVQSGCEPAKDSIGLQSASSPLLVHCSAGCGRTGVFITLDYLLNILEHPTDQSNRIDVWNMSQDLIFIVVNELRKQRISMVQNLTQYLTCYEGILEYFGLRKSMGQGYKIS